MQADPGGDELVAKVREHLLKKSGLLLEVRTARALRTAGWGVRSNVAYRDPESGVLREIDVRGSKFPAGADGVSLAILAIECSRTSKPWVFIVDDAVDHGRRNLDRLLVEQLLLNPVGAEKQRILQHVLDRYFWREQKALSRTWEVGPTNRRDEILDGLMKSLKAGYSELQTLNSDEQVMLLPLVVVEGSLMTATISESGDLSVDRADSVSVAVTNDFLPSHIGYVEVVSEAALPDTLLRAERLAAEVLTLLADT